MELQARRLCTPSKRSKRDRHGRATDRFAHPLDPNNNGGMGKDNYKNLQKETRILFP